MGPDGRAFGVVLDHYHAEMHEIDLMPNGDRTLGYWIQASCNDYAAARCCLLNGLGSGFLLAQQAVEKILKFYVRCLHPTHPRRKYVGKGPGCLSPGALPVHSEHDLVALAGIVDAGLPSLALVQRHEPILKRLSLRFEGKYPDSVAALGGYATSEFVEIDALMIPLLADIPVHPSLKWRLGIYVSCWRFVFPDERTVFPWDTWLFVHNKAFLARRAELIDVVRNRPGQS